RARPGGGQGPGGTQTPSFTDPRGDAASVTGDGRGGRRLVVSAPGDALGRGADPAAASADPAAGPRGTRRARGAQGSNDTRRQRREDGAAAGVVEGDAEGGLRGPAPSRDAGPKGTGP